MTHPVPANPAPAHRLRARRLGVETQSEAVVFMHADCPVGRSEGVTARTQIEVRDGARSIIATLYLVSSDMLALDEVGLSEVAWRRLGVAPDATLHVAHPNPLDSMSAVRAKVYGHRLDLLRLKAIVADVVAERYSDVQLAAFITAFSAQPPQLAETVALTRAMLEAGDRLAWPSPIVADKHCVGGLPGNRTTPLVVAIAAAAGLVIPKTSSRAITSPAGTADAMETMAPVDLDLAAMRAVVDREGGCIVWGGSVRLSPADDIFIRVERALDLDSEAQLVASVLSKKLAAGSTHVLLDLPVGPTAKVRTREDAERLSDQLVAVAAEFGMIVRPVLTDGSQPVGYGIGPALEAHDVLAVLRGAAGAPQDLRERAVQLAGGVLELGGKAAPGSGAESAAAILDDGRALAKFMAICEAQGGFREPPVAAFTHMIEAVRGGVLRAIDNRLLARVAKLAGAPRAKAAGVMLHAKAGDSVEPGQPLLTLHGESPGELDYALSFAAANPDMLLVRPR
ncbi:thymidine phosphorylase family protein [Sphingomonas canadensis]|uniref:Putative thymidine phosphorylase n=1 Tax=Sphingomonas canadensis TaxID=1219257 RepID=A0ABW3HDR2_9SPHN|nr:thymidine phosphorylase family protein [Sphingomonas canadensis]MCW3837293.1 thymidine phosphorylase family protein [Sphingomonas canadensis]